MSVEGAAAAAHHIAQAIKASGAIVRVEPEDFLRILERSSELLVVSAPGGFLSGGYEYLTSYKGLAFFAHSPTPINLPGSVEVIAAQKIWMPAR